MRRLIALFAIAAMACREGPGEPPAACQQVTVVVAKSSGVFLRGRAAPLVATAYEDAGGQALNPPHVIDVPVTWRSLDPAVVSVNAAAIATPGAVGATKLIAIACRISDTTAVSVIEKPYTVTLVPGGTLATTPVALNDSGAVVATSTQAGAFQNFLWKAGTATDLGGCIPMDVNNRGQVLCSGSGPTIWENGSATARDTVRSTGVALSDSAHVLTQSHLWRGPGSVVAIGGVGLNNVDNVIFNPPNVLYTQSYVWSQGQSTRILGFGRAIRALAINDSADVVGNSEDMSFAGRFGQIAFLARRGDDRGEKLRADAHLQMPNDIAETAVDINNQRQIIGSGSQGPFVWSDGKLGLLNQLVADQAWTITSVTRINNRGQILAQAKNSSDGITRAVLINPP
jgi:hypothetical protein